MKKNIQTAIFSIVFLGISNFAFAQNKTTNVDDLPLKTSLYNKYRKEVRAYDKKGFDDLFFAFFEKQNSKTILTKEEYYNYTIKIAIYAEKYGLLYKKEKEQAAKTKQEWFDRNYNDYLNSKKL